MLSIYHAVITRWLHCENRTDGFESQDGAKLNKLNLRRPRLEYLAVILVRFACTFANRPLDLRADTCCRCICFRASQVIDIHHVVCATRLHRQQLAKWQTRMDRRLVEVICISL